MERLKSLKYAAVLILIVVLAGLLYTVDFKDQLVPYGEPKAVRTSVKPFCTDPGRESTRQATRMCSHAERVRHLRAYCDEKFGYALASSVRSDANLTGFSSTKVFVSKVYEYLWCEVSKAGCTTLQRVFRQDYVTKKKRRILHVETMYEEYDGYVKFVNVRHPFDRLLSAYYNTIRKNLGDKRGPGEAQLNYLAALYNISHHNLTLSQFVEFLVSPPYLHDPSIFHDRHWDSYARSCKVCSVEFDYILRTETMAGDAVPILKRVEYPQDYLKHYDPQNVNPDAQNPDESNITDKSGSDEPTPDPSEISTFEKYLPELAGLNKDLIARLYDKYRHDFEAFGYHYDFREKKAYCGISLHNGEICC